MIVKKIFLILLALSYIGVGVFIFFQKVVDENIYNYSLAILFLLYGFWRLFRAFQSTT